MLAHLNDVLVGERLMWFIVFSVLEEYFVHICASILVQLVGAAEDDKCNFTVTKNTQFISLLHHAKLPLVECYLHIQTIGNISAVVLQLHAASEYCTYAYMDIYLCYYRPI
jgi:hypothetical protein